MREKIPIINDVLTGCLNNKSSSKEVIYKSYYGYLLAVILRYVNDINDVEELVNDSFIKIFGGINKFVPPLNAIEIEPAFKGWMAKIASHSAIDFLRSKRRILFVDDLASYPEPVHNVNVVSELNVKDILKLLNQLPEIQRIVFNLYEIEGFSHSEISKILTIPESSSRVYLTRAKNKLRTLYANTLINLYANS